MNRNNHLLSDHARLAIFTALILLAIASYINNKLKGINHERDIYQSTRFCHDFE